jgi:hypothetical protein
MVTETLLIVVIILLTLYLLRNDSLFKGMKRNAAGGAPAPTTSSAPSAEGEAKEGYEDRIQQHQQGNSEYFTSCCGESDGSNYLLGCGCPESNQIDFAVNEFGSPGLDYNAWVSSQAVDDQVVKNHVQFVQNVRGLGSNGEFTGRTYSPDSHESYDPISWVGLRRPEYVSLQNPTQVPDTDLSMYLRNRNFCLKT